MAVDLGSDSYKIALTRPGNYMEVVLNTESNRKTLNSVGFSPNERFVGDNAYGSARKFPKSTFRHPQFLLGHPHNSTVVNVYRERFPHVDLKKNDTTGSVVFSVENFKEEFSPEALLSMIITDAQMSASAFAKSQVKNMALVVRAFTDQTQRLYYQKAAKIAKMNLADIIDLNVATGIRYLVAKYGKMPAKLHNFMIVDVGAYHTDATVYSCEELHEKNKKNKKKNPYPSCNIIGYGYTFKGVGDFDSKIVDIIIDKFEKKANIKYSSIGNSRRNFTLLEEAKRIKKVLTSVTQTKIHLEGFFKDEDFISTITRSEIESVSATHAQEMLGAVDQALMSSKKSTDEITQVVLMGGGSRVPLVQSIIKQKTKTDRLSNVLNTDEDGVLGATFILASKSKFFKVKKIVLNKAAVYPVVALYTKKETNADGITIERTLEKVMYKHMEPIAQGKVLTIKNITDNLTLILKYGTIPEYYDQSSLVSPSRILGKYEIKGLAEAINKNKDHYNFDSIKVHVSFNEIGVVSITSAEAMFVKKESPSAFDKIKEKVTNLFAKPTNDANNVEQESTSGDPDHNQSNNATLTENQNQSDGGINNATKSKDFYNGNSTASTDASDFGVNNTTTTTQNTTDNNSKEKTTAAPPSKKDLAKSLNHTLSIVKDTVKSILLPSDDEIHYYVEKIRLIRKKEIEKERNAAALSKLESFINECRYNLESDGKMAGFVNSDELAKLTAAIEEKSAWFDEFGYQSNATVNKNVLNQLNQTLHFVYDRINEKEHMDALVSSSPTLFERMHQLVALINNSTELVKVAFNMTNLSQFQAKLDQLKKMTTVDYEEWLKIKPWENKPFNTTDVLRLVESIQREGIEHITKFTEINKEIERKIKEEERKKKRGAKKAAKKLAEEKARNETTHGKSIADEPLSVDNSTTTVEPSTTPSPEVSTESPKDEL